MTPLQAARHDLNCWVDECTELVGGNPRKPGAILKDAVGRATTELEIAVDRLMNSDDHKTLALVEGIMVRLRAALELQDYEMPDDAEPSEAAK